MCDGECHMMYGSCLCEMFHTHTHTHTHTPTLKCLGVKFEHWGGVGVVGGEKGHRIS